MSDDAVIRFISRNFVPVALNLYEIRKAPGIDGDFFRAVQKQKPAQYQGLYLVNADGKVLASHQNYKSEKTWSRELLADLQPGLRAFGSVQPREFRRVDPHPQRGVGILADGGVCLGLYVRYAIQGIPYRELPNPTIDSLVLTADDWRVLAPPKRAVGAEWAIKDEVGRKFARVLGPGDENSMPRPNEVKSVHFTARVQAIRDGVVYVGYRGAITGAHNTQSNRGLCHSQAELVGSARFDAKTGRLLALVWVFDGVFRDVAPYDAPKRFSAVAEWRKESR